MRLGGNEYSVREAAGPSATSTRSAALTLGNAVIATAEEHNALFPDRPVTVRRLALDHALMNFDAAAVGGVPMCRGAGGMAGHIRFGARTGGALVMLGIVLWAVGLFFADSGSTLFRLLLTLAGRVEGVRPRLMVGCIHDTHDVRDRRPQ